MMTGSEALAHGALVSGVQLVTSYPGSPTTATVQALLKLAGEKIRIEWSINEKSAFDTAFGASLAGARSMVCLKSVGLNVALDSLMVSNLAPGDGGFVILVGDDPGSWGSQNEEDSRLLVSAAEIPLLEPTSVAESLATMVGAFELSERFRVPVAVRITRALAIDQDHVAIPPGSVLEPQLARFERKGDRFNVLPIHVVEMHGSLQATVDKVQEVFERSPLNGEAGVGQQGIITAGYAASKLAPILAASNDPPLRTLYLSTLYPLPATLITSFLAKLDAVLVLEETAPYLETLVRATAQQARLTLPVLGRSTRHLPGAGELFAPQITQAVASLLPEWPWPRFEPARRTMPSRDPLCDDCPYIPTVEALTTVMERHGGRDLFVVTGEPGCIVRSQLAPWKMLNVKYGMGSSIGLASGLARTGIPQKVIALSGDSALLHSGLGELIDAVQAAVPLLVVVLDNGTTALSGGQPHPGTAADARGQRREPVDLEALIRAAGVDTPAVADPEDVRATLMALEEGLDSDRVAVVIARHACSRWAGETDSRMKE